MLTDPILLIRLENLRADLAPWRERDEEWWKTHLRPDLDNDDPNLGIRAFLESGIEKIHQNMTSQLREIEKALGNSPKVFAWREFTKLDRTTAELYREYFDCLGGRFERLRRLENGACRHADALFDKWCKKYRTRTLPAAHDQIRRDYSLIIRLRQPGSIWNIPYLAHEYGHFLIAELETTDNSMSDRADRKFANLRDAQIDRILKSDSEFGQIKPGKKAAKELLDELFADIFGVTILGPSYACSSLIMKLDPAARSGPKSHQSVDMKRAWAILITLERQLSRMGKLGVFAPLRDLVEWLWKSWLDSLKLGRPQEQMEHTAIDCYLSELVDDVAKYVEDLFDWERYKYVGWDGVQKWSDVLLGAGEISTVEGGTLADAFNASWLARSRLAIEGSGEQPLRREEANSKLNDLTKRTFRLLDAVDDYLQRKEKKGGKKMKTGAASSARVGTVG
jgi:hypothetical protein